VPAGQVALAERERRSSRLAEIDRVLGGGLVPGSAVLIGGEPGIGKSTLLLQVAAGLADGGRPALYVSGEESPQQLRGRAERLALALDGLELLAGTDCDTAAAVVAERDWALVVIDSIQTMRCGDLPSAPGSVSQVRESASRLVELCKQRAIPLFLIGHVTKEGTLAGPRTLEHLVDTVLYFEADPGRALRVVRAHKNRHGPVSEIGVFEMTGRGLVEVDNPSAAFLADRPRHSPGSVVFCTLRGSRPLLVEVQALVSPTPVAQPRRTAWGCDPNRVALLAAVLERRAGAQLAGCDLFLNVAGGLSLDEPAADLAVCTAVLSSLHDRPVPDDLAVFGEVGLAGEVRAVPAGPARAAEADRLGFGRLVLPAGNAEQLAAATDRGPVALRSVEELAEWTLETR
jgi:DNA repair protein RadA/Sms